MTEVKRVIQTVRVLDIYPDYLYNLGKCHRHLLRATVHVIFSYCYIVYREYEINGIY